jgi:hypothetical protein
VGSSQDVCHREAAGSRVDLDGASGVEYAVVEQGVERWGVLAVDAFFVDVEVGEERLVEQAAELSACGEVGGMAVARQVERCGQVRFDRVELCAGSAEAFFDTGDAFLLASNEIHRDCAAVDGFQELWRLAVRFAFSLDRCTDDLGR